MTLGHPFPLRLLPLTRAVLDVARELVLTGWTQGAYVRSDAGWPVKIDARNVRRVCAAGAIDRAGYALGASFEEREQIRAYLVSHLGIGDGGDAWALERWNDQPQRTRLDVLALYDQAIERLT